MALIVIPARYNSTRFPGKPLTLINNIPMVVSVYKRAVQSKLANKVIIATDNNKIFNCAKKYGCNVELTSSNHKSGTDRVAEVALKHNEKIIVNVQGDEPFIEPELIDKAIACLLEDKIAEISTPVKKIYNLTDVNNPNVVKVVFDINYYALYFSRANIPFYRNKNLNKLHYKHIGLYAFRKESLLKYINYPQSYLETVEQLEQLRALENNMKIKVFITEYESVSIDTPEDLKKIKRGAFKSSS